ncbi:MAG: hypothetical protein ACREH5_07680 [Candidatus Omnitrophota bacterium]
MASLCHQGDGRVEVEGVVLSDPVENFFEKLVDLVLGGFIGGAFDLAESLVELGVALGVKELV